MSESRAIAEEQKTLTAAINRRGQLLEGLEAEIARPPRDAVEEAAASALRRRRTELRSADQGLIFGRLDALDGTTRHIGRVGLPAADDTAEPLVLDWRAEAARAFYTATPIDPQGQRRRRHIRTTSERVVGVDDEPLDGSTSGELVGEGALLAALDERRTGTMGTAAATLQYEQDDIVRADARGVLIVQGGPGTGKTVVALHRVAYLLFARQDLARQGVLVLGPSPRFLDYIAQVLPALGETAVVSRTCDTLVPGVEVTRPESRELAEIKGRAMWQRALEAFVISLTPDPRDLGVLLDGERYVVPRQEVARAIESASAGRSYHLARHEFVERVHDLLTDAVVDAQESLLASMEEGFEDILAGVDRSLTRSDDRGAHSGVQGAHVDGTLSDDDIERIRSRVSEAPSIATVLDEFWPVRTPTATLRTLLTNDDLLNRWVPELKAAERAAIVKEPADSVAASDVPLLDAVAELLGTETRPTQGEFVAELAGADRGWTYGHVVVDEAQELSAMQWHMVTRRNPIRSITAVGDIDQAESPHAHRTWAQAVGPVLGDRYRHSELTICYRTPREVMALTAPVLRRAGSQNEPPRAVRSSGIAPWEAHVSEEELPGELARITTLLATRWAGGSVGIVAPERRLAALRGAAPDLPVVSATGAKGLEWDAALVVDPDGMTAEPRGWNGLYVALTRCTQELGQVHVMSRMYRSRAQHPQQDSAARVGRRVAP